MNGGGEAMGGVILQGHDGSREQLSRFFFKSSDVNVNIKNNSLIN